MKTHETPLTTTKSQTFSLNLWSIHFLAGHPTVRQRDVEKRPGQDEISRFALVPSTGAALLFLRDVDRENFGLTLDVGHLLMAGENPAQSVAMAGAAGKLFGIHLNDGHPRLGAEDGLAFASVHRVAALEVVLWLRRVNYTGSIYFDTFPKNEDPVREAELNVRRFEELWEQTGKMDEEIKTMQEQHDAMGVLEFLDSLA